MYSYSQNTSPLLNKTSVSRNPLLCTKGNYVMFLLTSTNVDLCGSSILDYFRLLIRVEDTGYVTIE